MIYEKLEELHDLLMQGSANDADSHYDATIKLTKIVKAQQVENEKLQKRVLIIQKALNKMLTALSGT